MLLFRAKVDCLNIFSNLSHHFFHPIHLLRRIGLKMLTDSAILNRVVNMGVISKCLGILALIPREWLVPFRDFVQINGFAILAACPAKGFAFNEGWRLSFGIVQSSLNKNVLFQNPFCKPWRTMSNFSDVSQNVFPIVPRCRILLGIISTARSSTAAWFRQTAFLLWMILNLGYSRSLRHSNCC